jgi:hypothetical protein
MNEIQFCKQDMLSTVDAYNNAYGVHRYFFYIFVILPHPDVLA